MTLRLALVGCGFMGRRHLAGLKRLRDIGHDEIELAAVCDVVRPQAEEAAAVAAELLGRRPDVLTDPRFTGPTPAIDAVIVTTPPATHEDVATAVLAAGRHVMVEKPLTLTVAQGRRLLAASERAGRVLAVAENYRRDPVNRLARAIIESGRLGRVYLAEQAACGRGDSVIISVWRHMRASGGILIDMGVHYADVIEYLLGPVDRIAGVGTQVQPARRGPDGAWHDVDAEDVCLGIAITEAGAFVHWMINYAARGDSSFRRVVYGTEGTMRVPRDRTGEPLQLVLSDGDDVRPIAPEEQLALVPGFALDDVTARLFGGERLASYELEWSVTDANLLAIEQADFAGAILEGRAPEVGGVEGLRALAVAYGFLDAGQAERTLRVRDLLNGAGADYQSTLVAP